MSPKPNSSGARRFALPVALALLVVLAGCGGGGTPTPDASATNTQSPSGDDDAPAATTTDGGTPAGGTDTATPTVTPSPTPTATPTPEPASLDGSALMDSHQTELSGADSFRSSFNYTVVTPNGTIVLTERAAVNFATGRARGASNLTTYDPDGTMNASLANRHFVEGNTLYTQSELWSSGEPLVFTDEETIPGLNVSVAMPGANGTATQRAGLEQWVVDQSWAEEGETTFRGQTVTEYRLTTDAIEEVLVLNVSVDEVEVEEGTLYVEDGVARYLHLVMEETEDGETVRIELTVRITDVGSTTVETPDWVQAQQD